jgi:hypothetical protein
VLNTLTISSSLTWSFCLARSTSYEVPRYAVCLIKKKKKKTHFLKCVRAVQRKKNASIEPHNRTKERMNRRLTRYSNVGFREGHDLPHQFLNPSVDYGTFFLGTYSLHLTASQWTKNKPRIAIHWNALGVRDSFNQQAIYCYSKATEKFVATQFRALAMRRCTVEHHAAAPLFLAHSTIYLNTLQLNFDVIISTVEHHAAAPLFLAHSTVYLNTLELNFDVIIINEVSIVAFFHVWFSNFLRGGGVVLYNLVLKCHYVIHEFKCIIIPQKLNRYP